MLEPKIEKTLRKSLKALLRDSLEWIESEQALLLEDTPYNSASPAEIRLFAALQGKAKSIAELSRILGVSRQAVHQTVKGLSARGVVILEHAENNRRDKIVSITEKGDQVRKLTAQHFRQIEAKVTKNIGKKNLELLCHLLSDNLEKAEQLSDEKINNKTP